MGEEASVNLLKKKRGHYPNLLHDHSPSLLVLLEVVFQEVIWFDAWPLELVVELAVTLTDLCDEVDKG